MNAEIEHMHRTNIKLYEQKLDEFRMFEEKAIKDEAAGLSGDRQFRNIFSTGTKEPLKRGETWRGRAENYLRILKKRADEAKISLKAAPEAETIDRPLLSLAIPISAGVLAWLLGQGLSSRLSTADMVNPEAMEDIAAKLPAAEDDFILAAWDYVASEIAYQGYSSNLCFINDAVKCSGCRLPETTMKVGRGNCVSMGSLLASILRNRLPPERVFMVVGELRLDGIGGHAWVSVQRNNGSWNILESTRLPVGWVPAWTVSNLYNPFAYFNDKLFYCYSEDICKVAVSACNCRDSILSCY